MAYESAIRFYPTNASTHYALGEALYALKRYEEAIRAYREFISLANKDNDKELIKKVEQKIADLGSKLKT